MEGGHGWPELQKQVEHRVKYSPAYGLKLRYKMPTTFLAWLGQSFHLGKKKVTLILIVPQLHSVICLSRSWATSWFSTSDPSLPLATTSTLSISLASPMWAILLKSWINQFTFCEQCDQMYSLFFNICYSTVQQWTVAQQHTNLLD